MTKTYDELPWILRLIIVLILGAIVGGIYRICKFLEFLGVKIDKEANNIKGEERIISAPDSKIKVMVVPTNEELMIARDTYEIVNKLK